MPGLPRVGIRGRTGKVQRRQLAAAAVAGDADAVKQTHFVSSVNFG